MKDEAQRYIEKAANALKVAQLNFDNEFYPDAVSKAYYSMFYSALALLIENDIQAKTHHGIENLLGKYFVKTGILDSALLKMFAQAMNDHHVSDYLVYKEISREKAQFHLDNARLFHDRLKEILMKNE